MQTLTIHIPDAQYPLIIEELNKFKDIRIELNEDSGSKEEILKGIRRAVNEINFIKEGKSQGRPAREFLNEL